MKINDHVSCCETLKGSSSFHISIHRKGEEKTHHTSFDVGFDRTKSEEKKKNIFLCCWKGKENNVNNERLYAR
jgi:hypothetical protein